MSLTVSKVTIKVAILNYIVSLLSKQGRPSTLTSLIKEAKQPEDSVRVASFALMQAIAYHAWGSQVIK